MNSDLKITVVYGGISSERDVSLKSGAAVANALKQYGYKNVELFDLTSGNISELLRKKPDVAYLALHGKGGEDGCIQGALELAGIAYTGPGVLSSAICMNKILTKRILKAENIPTAKYLEFNKNNIKSEKDISKKIIEELGLPVVLKSPSQGSSIGVLIVHKAEQVEDGVCEIFKLGDELLAEEYLSGVEITLPIIGNEDIEILPDIEITSEREFYDYKAKYTSGLCHHIIPARISDEQRRLVREIGKQVYKKLNCCGLSRIDFIVDDKKGPMVIEVNTLPGMTEMSLVPDAASSAGISFGELTSRILQYGIEAKR
ncbi:MAG: D-alanine--D-alanine ligase [Clostridia bacterium]|nr:D-alanine--D-alanine ligase [Clostridia bacterium]